MKKVKLYAPLEQTNFFPYTIFVYEITIKVCEGNRWRA